MLHFFSTSIFVFALSLIPIAKQQDSNQTKNIEQVYIGTWESNLTQVKVRSKTGWFSYEFTKDSISLELTIEEPMLAKGKLGLGSFMQANIKKNKGNDSVTGIRYIFECGNPGKLFDADSETDKKLELWIKPLVKQDTLEAELRLASSMDKFPMAHFILVKKN
ncbi:hypothetical protein EP331_06145 [bacterium]|nr:MAG: hypothetical protein EP331_06145 [bacterium]